MNPKMIADMLRGINNPVRIYMAQKFWGKQASYQAYSVQFTGTNVLVAAATQTLPFVVDAGYRFLCLSLGMAATVVADNTELAFPEVTVKISDTSSQGAWMPNPVHITTLFGQGGDNGRGPLPLVYPREMLGNAGANVQVTSMEAANINLYLTFHGVKVSETTEAS